MKGRIRDQARALLTAAVHPDDGVRLWGPTQVEDILDELQPVFDQMALERMEREWAEHRKWLEGEIRRVQDRFTLWDRGYAMALWHVLTELDLRRPRQE